MDSIDSMAYESSTISSCYAGEQGGGMYIWDVSNGITMTSIRLQSCSAAFNGGGIDIFGSVKLDLISVDFSQCWAGDVEQSHDIIIDSDSSAKCTATCTPGTFPPSNSLECSNEYTAKMYDNGIGQSSDDCQPYCLSAATDCEICGEDTYLSASMLTADGASTQCGEYNYTTNEISSRCLCKILCF